MEEENILNKILNKEIKEIKKINKNKIKEIKNKQVK